MEKHLASRMTDGIFCVMHVALGHTGEVGHPVCQSWPYLEDACRCWCSILRCCDLPHYFNPMPDQFSAFTSWPRMTSISREVGRPSS